VGVPDKVRLEEEEELLLDTVGEAAVGAGLRKGGGARAEGSEPEEVFELDELRDVPVATGMLAVLEGVSLREALDPESEITMLWYEPLSSP